MATYNPLQSIYLTSAVSSVTFSGIPQTYTDLVLVYTGTVSAQQQVTVTFNGSSSAYYSQTRLAGDASTTSSDRGSNQSNIYISSGNVAELSSCRVNINNYSSTTTYKTLLARWGNTSNGSVAAINALWRGSTGSSTEAITSLTVSTASAATFNIGSSFDLYGIKSGAPQALGGDVVTTDGNYWYHTFKSTQTFTPLRPLTADVLIVAGGGGGGADMSGGGGAGGLQGFTSQSLSATAYTVTVGAGGAGSTGSGTLGANGANSQFGALTASVGGGRSGNYITTTGASGGSGGGAGRGSGTTGGAGTAGQGYAGGNGSGVNYDGETGGGGGAGAAGGNGSGSGSGDGGIGSSTYSSWGSATSTGQNVSGTYYYAGGGGGGWATNSTVTGSGGNGGGGNGASSSTLSTAGTTNTGGGGGGGQGGGSAGRAGGSGIVIVRYPV